MDKEVAQILLTSLIKEMPSCKNWTKQIAISFPIDKKDIYKSTKNVNNTVFQDEEFINSIFKSRCIDVVVKFISSENILDLGLTKRNNYLKENHMVLIIIHNPTKNTNNKELLIKVTLLCGRHCGGSYLFHFNIEDEKSIRLINIDKSIS